MEEPLIEHMERDLARELPNGAVFDATETYRYLLWRTWDANLPRVCFVMLNPSTADAEMDDGTIRKCRHFAATHGFGGIEVVNLFAFRTPYPEMLRHASDPAGPDNSRYVQAALARCTVTIAAWGVHGRRHWRTVQAIAGRGLLCLGTTKGGHPRHPGRIALASRLEPWSPPDR